MPCGHTDSPGPYWLHIIICRVEQVMPKDYCGLLLLRECGCIVVLFFFLFQEVSQKSEVIAQLEREKATLIRELFQARSQHRAPVDETTLMWICRSFVQDVLTLKDSKWFLKTAIHLDRTIWAPQSITHAPLRTIVASLWHPRAPATAAQEVMEQGFIPRWQQWRMPLCTKQTPGEATTVACLMG